MILQDSQLPMQPMQEALQDQSQDHEATQHSEPEIQTKSAQTQKQSEKEAKLSQDYIYSNGSLERDLEATEGIVRVKRDSEEKVRDLEAAAEVEASSQGQKLLTQEVVVEQHVSSNRESSTVRTN